MSWGLAEHESSFHEEVQTIAARVVAPYASEWEIARGFPRKAVGPLAERGYLGGMVPRERGGLGWDSVTYGLFTEAIARHSVSLSGLFNVHTMVVQTLLRWGNDEQKEHWLPALVRGEKLAAIAFTEPGAGSDLKGIATRFEREGDHIIVTGEKKWITCGGIADVVLVFGWLDEKPAALLMDTTTPGFAVKPLREMLGFRAAHLAKLSFDRCQVPATQLVGRPGFALMYLAPYALDFGRVSVAWACVGMLRACVETCSEHILSRRTFGHLLADHGMIQTLMTQLGIHHQATLLHTLHACRAKDHGDVNATEATFAAKYFASRMAVQETTNAVQIMGALGCDEEGAIARHFRDAKTTEIIEGSNQIIEGLLAKSIARAGRDNHRRFLQTEAKPSRDGDT